MKFSKAIFPVDARLESGRIYPQKVIEKAINEFASRETETFGRLRLYDAPSVAHITHIVERVRLDDCMFTADMRLLDVGTEYTNLINRFQIDNFIADIIATGRLSHDGVVSDFTLTTVDLVPSFAYKPIK